MCNVLATLKYIFLIVKILGNKMIKKEKRKSKLLDFYSIRNDEEDIST